ncbi:BBP7 family outer membrane beta-barrel protein [Gemmata sp.]|uniref:BBP7 family outer membrane beta-barrel protein n=1 Tax=Gemmata sp. TaxID=1914242 RepID=UPI003F728A53
MRKGFLGSIAALAAGAGTAWGQYPAPVAPAGGPPPAAMAPAAIGPAMSGAGPAMGAALGPVSGEHGPNPVLMPPIAVGPPGDPMGLGPTATLGPPPGPMYPNPGPYTAPMYQPAPSSYGTPTHAWFTGEYLLLFNTSQPGPGIPLLTTGSPNQAGVLGQPTTTALIGGGEINYGGISGFRLGAGFFGDADRRFGFDFSSMYAAPKQYSKTFDANSGSAGAGGVNSGGASGSIVGAGIPVLARPFIDTNTGNTSLVIVAPNLPGLTPNSEVLAVGRANVNTRSSFWSADPAAIWNVYRAAPESRFGVSIDALVGYKYAQLNEEYVISSQTLLRGVTVVPQFTTGPFGVPVLTGFISVPDPIGVGGVVTASPSTIDIADRFVTTNRFNGGDFGLRMNARYGVFNVSATGRVAIGNMHQTLRVRGVTSFQNTDNGRNGFAYAGLYANASNIGTFTNDEFAVIPDLNLTVGVNLTRCLSMYVGYNFVYLNKVIRPGNQLNPLIDATTVPFSTAYGNAGGVPSPLKGLIQDDFTIQGVSFGFGLKY